MHVPTKHPDPRIVKADRGERGERTEGEDRAGTAFSAGSPRVAALRVLPKEMCFLKTW
jgi:hypothetical protein